jgi:7-carboxy-7-deazaguanine synthase
MTAKIMEIFRSVQGEGPYAGVSQVFVRFFECNMHCSWCDTPASIGDTSRNYKEMTADELFAQIAKLYDGCHSVSITGGEPLLQVEFLKDFLPRLKEAGMTIYLETNGTLPVQLSQILNDTDIVSMDIKLPSSTGERAFWDEHAEFLRIAMAKPVFVKVVVSQNTTDEDVVKAAELVKRIAPNIPFILQPNYFDMKEGSTAKCVDLQKKCASMLKDIRVLPQTHKFMKLP